MKTTYKKYNWKRRSHQFHVEKQKRKAAKALRQLQKRRRHGSSDIYKEDFMYSYRSNNQNRSSKISKLFSGYKQIKAPSNLSLLNNETVTLDFIRKLQVCYTAKKKVAVLLDDVITLTTDAILVLLSNMVHYKAARIGFNGTKPRDNYASFKLESSGFFKHLYGAAMREQDRYSFKKMNNFIYTHGQKTVEASLADDLVKYASEVVWGEPRRCPGIQTTLVELMHNTYDHAGEFKGEKHWWISVEHDEQAHEATFSFIDFGVGIFRSLANKKQGEPLYGALDYIIHRFPLVTTEADRLQLILEGKVRLTQFNEYYRGKGLRNIYLKHHRNYISDLSIISNYASFKAENDDYHSLKNEFIGTFISFKMNRNTHNLQWEI